jgi:ABC-type transport system involved in multi-copper enzyme maturation permease subunit
MLDQLMWKDFRNQSGILVLGLFFLAGPYGLYWFYDRDPNTLAVSVMLSLIASQITVIVMGATIIGLERQNHGLDFLLGQPIPKSKILLSKSLVCLIVAVVIWGTSLLVTAVFVDAEPQIVLNGIMQGTAITGSTLFAVAWLFSIFCRGFAIPVGAGLTVTALLFFVTVKFVGGQDLDSELYMRNLARFFYPACLITACCSFVAGWSAFLRRLEP